MSKLFTQYRVRLGRIAREIQMDLNNKSLTDDESEALIELWSEIKSWLENTTESED